MRSLVPVGTVPVASNTVPLAFIEYPGRLSIICSPDKA